MFSYMVVGLIVVGAKLVNSLEEPICTSRFDYDHKMLQKMVMLEFEQRNTKTILEEMKAMLSMQTGSTFVRWGRTQCPENGTELVYKGYAGGSFYTNTGASSNYLCLPEEPLWNVYEDMEQSSGTVWGAEYELHSRNMENFFDKTLIDNDVPCCVCRTKRASVLFIPGRNKCYDGWTLEYEGYLTGGQDSHHASSEFVCLDAKPEIIEGSQADKNGKLFYFAEARCGSLRCPPYVNGRELSCVVCTK